MAMMVRVRVYRGDGAPMGEIQAVEEHVQQWLAALEDPRSQALCGVRDLVDPDHENACYDWDIWAKPAEVSDDLGGTVG